MAFSATLHIEGHPKYNVGIDVVGLNFTFSQVIGSNGKPHSRVIGSSINLSVLNMSDRDIFEWMFSQNGQKKGKIVLTSGIEDDQSFQVIQFEEAYLVNYNQVYSKDGEVMANFSIMCQTLDISGAKISLHNAK
ncbi:MAG: type VI secretion system tube protein TssD [Bacteroidetes bacterium]|nr:type VI secretion system tube protein TssD [Bacteroidota bacterium]